MDGIQIVDTGVETEPSDAESQTSLSDSHKQSDDAVSPGEQFATAVKATAALAIHYTVLAAAVLYVLL